jgi:hypothetical protein
MGLRFNQGESIGIGMSPNGEDLCHNHLIKPFPYGRGPLHLQTCHGKEMGQLFPIHPDLDVILEPIQTDLHLSISNFKFKISNFLFLFQSAI